MLFRYYAQAALTAVAALAPVMVRGADGQPNSMEEACQILRTSVHRMERAQACEYMARSNEKIPAEMAMELGKMLLAGGQYGLWATAPLERMRVDAYPVLETLLRQGYADREPGWLVSLVVRNYPRTPAVRTVPGKAGEPRPPATEWQMEEEPFLKWILPLVRARRDYDSFGALLTLVAFPLSEETATELAEEILNEVASAPSNHDPKVAWDGFPPGPRELIVALELPAVANNAALFQRLRQGRQAVYRFAAANGEYAALGRRFLQRTWTPVGPTILPDEQEQLKRLEEERKVTAQAALHELAARSYSTGFPDDYGLAFLRWLDVLSKDCTAGEEKALIIKTAKKLTTPDEHALVDRQVSELLIKVRGHLPRDP